VRLGVFGGSFDPIHNAHLIVAGLAREQLALDRVAFVVAAAQPLKHQGHAATAEMRAGMAELAIADVPGFSVDRRELNRPGPSYTVDTLRELAAADPGAELVLLLGADTAMGFGAWRDPAVIRSLARVAVFRRGAEVVPPGFDATVDVPALEISSSTIRARVRAGQPLAGWVPPRVADYIVAARIYLQ
jgi:nicotinate-nucleotide adenylyltransferase